MSEIHIYGARFDGRIAVVTGAGSASSGDVVGVGRAIAIEFSRKGATLVLVDLDEGRARETQDVIHAEGGKAIIVLGDVAQEQDCIRIYDTVQAQLGDVSILVNNVGITIGGGKLESLEPSVWDRSLAVNLTGALHMTKHAISHFRRCKRGTMVHISSIGGMLASGAGVCYASSKAAMIAMSREFALMYGREGFRSNVIAPGHCYTAISQAAFTEEVRVRRRKVSPLGIEGTAWDVAKAAAFLASDDARYITGVCLPVDGGVTGLGAFAAYGLINET